MAKEKFTEQDLKSNPELKAFQEMDLQNNIQGQIGLETAQGEEAAGTAAAQGAGAEAVAGAEAAGTEAVGTEAVAGAEAAAGTEAVVGAEAAAQGTTLSEEMLTKQRNDFAKEIFGDRYETAEEAVNANIPSIFDEVETLRNTKTELEGKLEAKPKTDFASDEMALFNVFAKETGKSDFGLFRTINNADFATMDSMVALKTKYRLDNPASTATDGQLTKFFERKYNVDPETVEADELEINKISMMDDANVAKNTLIEVKEKLKIPEPVEELSKPKELSKEEQAVLKTGWEEFGAKVGQGLAKLKIPITKGDKQENLLDYEISEVEQQEVKKYVANYAVTNRMELNEANAKFISQRAYNELMINKLPDLVHSVFEKARSMTQEEVHAMYENPSPLKNKDVAPVIEESNKTDLDSVQERIMDAERKSIL